MTSRSLLHSSAIASLGFFLVMGCSGAPTSGDPDTYDDTGGASGKGGANAGGSGGASSGGTTGSGGSTSAGGTVGSGGASSSGGSTGSGGRTGSGGGAGSLASGGSTGSGGSTRTGGASGTGGARTGGTTGTGAGGTTAAGGSTGVGGSSRSGGSTGAGGVAGNGGTPGGGRDGGSSEGGAPGTGGSTGATFDWGSTAYNASGGSSVRYQGHYTGQTCVNPTCHRHNIGFGGTVYQANGSSTAGNVQIGIRIGGNLVTAYSGSQGNFYGSLSGSGWSTAQIAVRNASGTVVMPTNASASGECNSCHGSSNRIVAP